MKTNLSEIKELAEELIDTYALTIPVHIFELADLMGIKWKTCTTEQIQKVIQQNGNHTQETISDWNDVLGYFDPKEERIYLNDDNQPITRKRFTMAHEIAHNVLHHSLDSLLRRVFLRQDIVIPRDSVEAEANYFAGYLLMPDKTMKERLKYIVLMGNGEQIVKTFAKTFAVSSEAMRIRFKTFKQEYPELWKEFNLDEKLF